MMSYANDPDIAQFFTADACKAAGIEQSTLKNWISRSPPAILISEEERAAIGVAGPSRERLATGSGRSHLFTFRRVMQLALCAELVRLGFPPRKAGVVAAGFTDVGDGERYPCELFASGLTVLVAEPETECGRVLNASAKTPLRDLFHSGTGKTSAVVVVNVFDIWDRVISSLGLDKNWFRPSHARNRREDN